MRVATNEPIFILKWKKEQLLDHWFERRTSTVRTLVHVNKIQNYEYAPRGEEEFVLSGFSTKWANNLGQLKFTRFSISLTSMQQYYHNLVKVKDKKLLKQLDDRLYFWLAKDLLSQKRHREEK